MEGDGSGVSEMLVRSKHIYIFSLHVFNEAFQLEAFLEDIMRLVYSGLVEIRCRFCLPEERHVVSTVGGVLGILLRSPPSL